MQMPSEWIRAKVMRAANLEISNFWERGNRHAAAVGLRVITVAANTPSKIFLKWPHPSLIAFDKVKCLYEMILLVKVAYLPAAL
jgi:hypothetical protein